MRLSGKTAVVTGIGSGIGQCCALMFARQAARVVGAELDAAADRSIAALDHQLLAQRIGQPEDIGWATVYLARDESAWMTATDLRVHAGATAC